MNPFDMLKNIQNIQSAMQTAQARIQATTAEGQSGGGLVKVTMDGTFKIKQLFIDPSLTEPEDIEMIGDLVKAAANLAHEQIAAMIQKEMSAASGGLPIPNLFGQGT
jgi:DNA-binding YbaB/EbfC family protein